LEENKKSQHRQRGRSTTNDEGGIVHHPHKIPSSGHKSQEINVGKERVMRDVWVMEMVGTPSIPIGGNTCCYSCSQKKKEPIWRCFSDLDGLELNMTDMEVDEVNNMPAWAVVQIE
jgi:hypothetical protein